MPRYVAKVYIELDGSPAPENLMEDIIQVSVEESLHLPAMFTLIVSNPYFPGRLGEEPWQHDRLFQFGKKIRIAFGSSTMDSPEFNQEQQNYVIEGEITAIESHFDSESQAPIVIRGYDYSHRLHRGRHCRSFQNMTDSDIVQKIAEEVGITLGTVDPTTGPHGYNDINGSSGYVFQENQTNMEFLRERAARIGYELFMEDSKLNFRAPDATTALQLNWLEDILSFRVRLTSAEQVEAIEVRGWDYSQKREIVTTKNAEQSMTETEYGQGSSTGSVFNGKPTHPTVMVVDQPVFTPEEADLLAQALCDELGTEFVYADGRADGNPKIRPGRLVKLKKMGKYSGRYYITETRHLLDNGIYTTEFSVRGLRGGDLLTTLFPRNHLQPGQTHLVGIVTENKDPKGWGRIRVKFPTLSNEHNSYWARMVQVGAGANRGFDCLPEIGDEVLVAFEHGDIHRPYILGGVWNGQDLPPEPVNNVIVSEGITQGTVRLRTFKTRVGHQIQFAEEDPTTASDDNPTVTAVPGTELFSNASLNSLKGVHFNTIAGHTLDLCDPNKAQVNCVRLKTALNHKLSLTDSSTNSGIALQTAIGQSVSLIDVPLSVPAQPQINLNTAGNVVINAGATPIPPTGLASAKQTLALGPAAAITPPALSTFMNLLSGKVLNPLSSVELSGGFINHLSLGGVTTTAGPISAAKVLPEQIHLHSLGMTLNVAPIPPILDVPTPGMLNLNASVMVKINAMTSVVITAPTILLNGAVNINGSLTANGKILAAAPSPSSAVSKV